MAKQDKAVWEGELPVYIDDNTTENVTPADERYVFENMADSVPWLTSNNLLEGTLKTKSSTLQRTVRSSDNNVSIGTEDRHVVYGSSPGYRQFGDPADAANWDSTNGVGRMIIVKSQASVNTSITCSETNKLYTYAAVNSFNLIPGQMIIVWSDGTYWNIN